MDSLSADGPARGRLDINIAEGIAPDEAARQIADGLEQSAREVVIAQGSELEALKMRTAAPQFRLF